MSHSLAPTNEIIGASASLNALSAACDRNTHVTNQLLKEAADRVANLKKAIEEQEATNKPQEVQHLKELEPMLAEVKELQAEKISFLQDKEKLAKNLSEIPSFADLKVQFQNYCFDYEKRHPGSLTIGGCVIC